MPISTVGGNLSVCKRLVLSVLALMLPAIPSLLSAEDWDSRAEFEDQQAIVSELEALDPEAAQKFVTANQARWRKDAIAHLERVLELVPDSDVAMRRLGELYYQDHKFEKGFELMEQAYAIRPRPETAACLSHCLYEDFAYRMPTSGKLERAGELAFAACEAHPSDLRSLRIAAGAASRLEDQRKQARVLELALLAIDGGRVDIEFLEFTYSIAARLDNRATVERLFRMTDGALDAKPASPRRLELRAASANYLGEWTVLRRVARHFDRVAPNSERARRVNQFLVQSPRSKRIRAVEEWIRPIWDVVWLRSIVGGSVAVLLSLGAFFGVRRMCLSVVAPDEMSADVESSPEPLPIGGENEDQESAIIPPASEPPIAGIWIEVTLLTAVGFLAVPMISMGLQLSILGPYLPRELSVLMLLLMQSIGLIAIGSLMRRWTCGSGIRASEDTSVNGLMGLAYGAAIIATSAVAAVVLGLFGESPQEQQWILELMKNEVAFALLLPIAVLVVPLAEEIFFRGYVFERLRQRGGRVPAYLLSACLFAAAHANPAVTPIHLVQGIVLARAYDSRRSIITAFIAHSINNLVAVAVTRW